MKLEATGVRVIEVHKSDGMEYDADWTKYRLPDYLCDFLITKDEEELPPEKFLQVLIVRLEANTKDFIHFLEERFGIELDPPYGRSFYPAQRKRLVSE